MSKLAPLPYTSRMSAGTAQVLRREPRPARFALSRAADPRHPGSPKDRRDPTNIPKDRRFECRSPGHALCPWSTDAAERSR